MTIYRSRFAISICPALSVMEFVLPGLATSQVNRTNSGRDGKGD